MLCRDPICVEKFFRLLVRVRELVESMQPDRYEESLPFDMALMNAKRTLEELEREESRIVMRDVRDGIEARYREKSSIPQGELACQQQQRLV